MAWFRLRVSRVTWAAGQRNVAFRSAKVLSRSERRQTDPAGVDPSHTELEPPFEPCRSDLGPADGSNVPAGFANRVKPDAQARDAGRGQRMTPPVHSLASELHMGRNPRRIQHL